jgi:chromosome segregation ATPase
MKIWKICLTVAIVLGFGYVVFGGNNFRWFVKSKVAEAKGEVWDSISLQTKLGMAKKAHEEMKPLAVKYTKQVVMAEWDVDQIQARVKEYESGMVYSKSQILKEKEDLSAATKAGKKTVNYKGTEYTLEDLEKDLAKKFEVYQSNEQILVDLRKTLESRKTTLDNYRTALGNAEKTASQLGAKITLLESRLAAVESNPKVVLDDKSGDLKALIADIDANITAAERVTKAAGGFDTGLQVPDPKSTEDMLKKIDEHFKR